MATKSQALSVPLLVLPIIPQETMPKKRSHLERERIVLSHMKKRKKLEKKKHQQHSLQLEDLKEKQEAGSLSAPTPGRQKPIYPLCPKCKHRRCVKPWRWWSDKRAMIYHCYYQVDVFGSLCGHMWIKDEEKISCPECHAINVRIQEHGKELGYWCNRCDRLYVYEAKQK